MLHLLNTCTCRVAVVDAHHVVGTVSIVDAQPACLQDIDSPSSTSAGTEHSVSMSVTELTPMLKRKNKKISSAALKKSNSFHVSVSSNNPAAMTEVLAGQDADSQVRLRAHHQV